MEAAHEKASEKPEFSEYDYSNFYYGAGEDPLNLLRPFAEWYREARPNGYYLYQEALASAPTTHVRVKNGRTGQWQDLLNLANKALGGDASLSGMLSDIGGAAGAINEAFDECRVAVPCDL